MADLGNVSKGTPVNRTLETMKEVGRDTARELQEESKDAMKAFLLTPGNPYLAKARPKKKNIKAHSSRIQEASKAGEKADRLLPIAFIKDTANRFQQKNPELKANVLILLREQIKPDDSAEDILKKVLQFYPDVSLADEALEFLLETTEGSLHQRVQEAKDQLNNENGREIAAGRNIAEEARTASDKGIGSPTSLRDLYRGVTDGQKDAGTLFEDLSSKYDFADLTKIATFILHSLGADLKAKGPSIPSGQLHALIKETRAMQAILGVYRFFKGRMPLLQKLFQKEGINLPKKLTFESLAKLFMTLAGDRYPTGDKVKQGAKRLGIEDWIIAKIIAFSQLRDAVRQVALNQIFRSIQHRDDLLKAIIEALEELEEELEEFYENQEEDDEDENDSQWEDDEEWEEIT